MTEPTTEAGLRLLRDWQRGDVLNRLPEHGGPVAAQIARVETEARVSAPLDVERLARAMVGAVIPPRRDAYPRHFPNHPEHWTQHADDAERRFWRDYAASIAAEYARLTAEGEQK